MPYKKPVIAIITDDPGWHGQRLQATFLARGFDSVYLSLTDCRLNLDQTTTDLVLANMTELPVGVFVRGVPSGSLEQIIFRLNILHTLQSKGITVFNTPRSIEKTVDKSLTSILLKQAGLPTPHTWVCESAEIAKQIMHREHQQGHDILQKPLFGSQGIGITRLQSGDSLIGDEQSDHVYYLQRFIPKHKSSATYVDYRVLVIDDIVVAIMKRTNQHWLTNRAQGAHCQSHPLQPELATLAQQACQVLDIHYAGVDIIQHDNGYQIIEVNSIPSWFGLQQVSDINITDRLAEAFINKINRPSSLSIIS